MTSRSRKPAFPHPAPSFLQAVRLTRARPGPPSENDLPPVQPFPGPRAAILPGQLTLDGREVVKYLSTIPAEVPAGWVVVHNNVRATGRLGSRGFRAWLTGPSDRLSVCECGWAPELGEHYRVNLDGDEAE
jgi:hypothetical protein